MKYRPLRCGEIVQATDEYKPFGRDEFVRVSPVTVGQALLDCNTPYYRRPLTVAEPELFEEGKDA